MVVSWVWVGLSAAFLLAFAVLQSHLPSPLWLNTPTKGGPGWLRLTTPHTVYVTGLAILGLQALLAIYATVRARMSPDTVGEQPRKLNGLGCFLTLFVSLLLFASWLGAETLLASIPPQVNRPLMAYYVARASLGFFSNPVADVVNLVGVLAVAVAVLVLRRPRQSVASGGEFDERNDSLD